MNGNGTKLETFFDAYCIYMNINTYNVYTFMYNYIHVHVAVLFLEFWKRRQFFLQYEWDMLGYESAEVSGRRGSL